MPSSEAGLSVGELADEQARRGALRGWGSEVATFRTLLGWLPIWVLIAASVVGLAAAYQVPRSYIVNVGSPRDEAYTGNFHTRLREGERDFRWSDIYGYVSFPGLGGARPFTATVTLDTTRSAPVALIVNGTTFYSGTLGPGWQRVEMRVDSSNPGALASRDTVIEVRAPELRTPDLPSEAKGVRVDSVRVEQDAGGGFIVPPYTGLGAFAAALLVLYLLVGRALAGFAPWGRVRAWGVIVSAVAALGLIVAVVQDHVAVSAAAPHLVITGLTALALLVLVDRLAARTALAHHPAVRRWLGVIVAGAFVLRFGGMALPQAVIIDMPWHMKWLGTLIAGDWESLYFPGGLSSVPAEWGLAVLIPKSPLFYFAFAPLHFLPFDLETSSKWLISLIDATVVMFVFWLALRVGGSNWAAICGASIYALLPLVFRGFAYGILPTIFAQWLATGALVALLGVRNRKWGVALWAGLLALMALSLLAFPTVALFLTLVLLGVVVVWWRVDGSGGGRRAVLTPFGRVVVLLIIGWALALAAYYGLYISPVVKSLEALLAPRAGGGTVRWEGGFPELLAWTADYVVTLLPYVLGVIGIALLLSRRQGGMQREAVWVLVIWASIAPLFVLVNYRVDMIGKHLFFTMVPFAVAGGIALWGVARRGRWAALLAGLMLITVGWQGLVFWVERLVRAST